MTHRITQFLVVSVIFALYGSLAAAQEKAAGKKAYTLERLRDRIQGKKNAIQDHRSRMQGAKDTYEDCKTRLEKAQNELGPLTKKLAEAEKKMSEGA